MNSILDWLKKEIGAQTNELMNSDGRTIPSRVACVTRVETIS
jgi:hypothetical protein